MAALTEKKIAALKYKGKFYDVRDGIVPGMIVRVRASKKEFMVSARDSAGKPVRKPLGVFPAMSLDAAREQALAMRKAISGNDGTASGSFFDVSRMWFRRHVLTKKLRSSTEIERTLRNHLKAWDDRPFESITRRDIAQRLDEIEDTAGPCAADKTLATISRVCAWYETRHDHYRSPVVRGMRRSDNKARDRILTDDEIRKLWEVTEDGHVYSAMIRMMLLTGQRKEKVQTMRWSDIEGSTWTVPQAERGKGTGKALVLPEGAMAVLQAQPYLDYVFPGRTKYFNGLSKAQRTLAARCEFSEPWTPHDLRRTARSLMARAGVSDTVAERVLGHAIAGVQGIYNRHAYDQEKAQALVALDNLITEIRQGKTTVIPLAKHRKTA